MRRNRMKSCNLLIFSILCICSAAFALLPGTKSTSAPNGPKEEERTVLITAKKGNGVEVAQLQNLNYGRHLMRYRFECVNTRPTDAVVGATWFNRSNSSRLSRRILVPAGTVRILDLSSYMNDSIDGYGHGVVLQIDGKSYLEESTTISDGFNGNYSNTLCYMFEFKECDELYFAWDETFHDRYDSRHSFEMSMKEFPLGTRFIDYEGARIIMIGKDAVLPEEVRQALELWVWSGGILMRLFAHDDDWPYPEPEGMHKEPFGSGMYCWCQPMDSAFYDMVKAKMEEEEKTEERRRQYYGREEGKLREVLTAETPSAKRFMAWKNLVEDDLQAEDSEFPLDCNFVTPEKLLPYCPLDVPLIWIWLVLLAFAVLVGPVNYLFLRRRHKEVLLLVTIPGLSLLFCLLVIGFISIHDGWSSRGVMFGISYLDQKRQLCRTCALVDMYTPQRFRHPFEFEEEEAVDFYDPRYTSGAIRQGPLLTADDRRNFSYSPKLAMPRTPMLYKVKRAERRMECLRLSRDGEGIQALNALGETVERLWVVTPDGQIFASSGPIGAGERSHLEKREEYAPISPVSQNAFSGISLRVLRETLFPYDADAMDKWEKRILPVCLVKGTYIALLKRPVFYEPGQKPDISYSMHLVFGRYNPEDIQREEP